jgi:hypothetical protein
MNTVRFSRFAFLLVAAILLTVSVASAAGPYQFFSVTPCRLADTRGPNGVSGGPALAGLQTRSFPVRGLCGVPSDAQAAALNVTIVGPTNSGHLTIWPFQAPTGQPFVSTLNYEAGEPALANGAIVPLGTDATFQISVFAGIPSGTVNLVLDITGYFK